MSFYRRISYVTHDYLPNSDSYGVQLSVIINLNFKKEVPSKSWKPVKGVPDCYYAIRKNRFTENWFFIKIVKKNGSRFAELATQVILLKHGDIWIHENEATGAYDAIYRGRRKIVAISQYV